MSSSYTNRCVICRKVNNTFHIKIKAFYALNMQEHALILFKESKLCAISLKPMIYSPAELTYLCSLTVISLIKVILFSYKY